MRRRGIDVLLFTSDGPTDTMLQAGTLPNVLKTANFGSNAGSNFDKLRQYQPEGPLTCMEFWNGWFDTWGFDHVTRDAADAAKCLDEMLAAGGSVNVYMFHGGTNFGFSSGANFFDNQYRPIATSYDYDAPLSEDGELTPKYHAYREVIGKYRTLPDLPLPTAIRKAAFGRATVDGRGSLLANVSKLATPIRTTSPEPMEALGQNDGFILYRTHISGPRASDALVIDETHDRAHVFVDGVLLGTQDRNDVDKEAMKLEIPDGGIVLDILVENMGRINFGPYLLDRKGITKAVRFGFQHLHGWEIYCLPMDDLSAVEYGPLDTAGEPAFYRAHVDIDDPADTYLSLPGWTRGCCFVNGFNLGRYRNEKPHRNLYVPAPLLRTGRNEIVLLELDGRSEGATIELVDRAV
jgi:beta-galactosidase